MHWEYLVGLVGAVAIIASRIRRTSQNSITLDAIRERIGGTLVGGSLGFGAYLGDVNANYHGRTLVVHFQAGRYIQTKITLGYKRVAQLSKLTEADCENVLHRLKTGVPEQVKEMKGELGLYVDSVRWQKWGPVPDMGSLQALLDHLEFLATELETYAASKYPSKDADLVAACPSCGSDPQSHGKLHYCPYCGSDQIETQSESLPQHCRGCGSYMKVASKSDSHFAGHIHYCAHCGFNLVAKPLSKA